MSFAVADRRISHNPCVGVSLPRLVATPPRFLARDQVMVLAEAAGQDRDVMLTLSHTGLRFGELVAMRVCDLDLTRRRLYVQGSTSEVRGKQVSSATKTHRTRWVPLPAFLVRDLAARAGGRGGAQPLFTSPDGGPLKLGNWRGRVFDKACTSARIEDLTPHDVRHTAASLAVSAGANVKMVQRMLGHASAAMTLDVYAALFEDDLDALGDRLDAAHREHVSEGARKIF